MRLLVHADLLPEKGIPYTRQHIHRLVREKKFPAPIKIGNGGRNAWYEETIDNTIREWAEASIPKVVA